MNARVRVGATTLEALEAGRAVVALESTIFSHLGLPSPRNRQALDRCLTAVASLGATPALTAVIDGQPVVGAEASDHDLICGSARKVAARDLGVAIGQRWPYGATTVSATLRLAAAAGVSVFATGGIGGVHRGVATTGDVSGDLDALACHQVVTVSAGAKSFLDLPRTLEYLETVQVPVLGWRCDELPAFWSPTSGIGLAHRADTAADVAAIARAHWELGGAGVLVVAPVPADAGIPFDELSDAIAQAVAAAEAAGTQGGDVTPAVLAELTNLTDGRNLDANLALAEHNARVAAEIAVALALAP